MSYSHIFADIREARGHRPITLDLGAKRVLHERTCRECQAVFNTHTPNKQTCSEACRDARARKEPSKVRRRGKRELVKDVDATCCGRRLRNCDFEFDRLGRSLVRCPICQAVAPLRKGA